MRIHPQTILVVNIRLIGDVILTTPLIGLLKEAYPQAAIDMLVGRGTGEFLEKDPRIRAVFYDESGRTGQKRSKMSQARRLFRRYDLAINMNSSDRGSIAILLAGKRWTVGFNTGVRFWQDIWKRMLFTHPIRFPYPIHMARLCEVVGKKLGIPITRLEAKVFWDKEDEDKIRAALRNQGVSRPYFVVHPFARWRYKHWRLEHFASVSDTIAERYRLHPIWTSSPSPEERMALNQASALCRIRPLLIPGEFDLNKMTCLLSQASFYLGLDTAVSHLAATTGIPMVALYGPTIADWWAPWNNQGPVNQQYPLPRGTQRSGNIIVLQKDMPCIPCGKAGCNDNGIEPPCLLDVTPGEVLEAVASLLKPAGGGA